MIPCHHTDCDHVSADERGHFQHWEIAHLRDDLEQRARPAHGNSWDDVPEAAILPEPRL